jgi:hypothetical protein
MSDLDIKVAEAISVIAIFAGALVTAYDARPGNSVEQAICAGLGDTASLTQKRLHDCYDTAFAAYVAEARAHETFKPALDGHESFADRMTDLELRVTEAMGLIDLMAGALTREHSGDYRDKVGLATGSGIGSIASLTLKRLHEAYNTAQFVYEAELRAREAVARAAEKGAAA